MLGLASEGRDATALNFLLARSLAASQRQSAQFRQVDDVCFWGVGLCLASCNRGRREKSDHATTAQRPSSSLRRAVLSRVELGCPVIVNFGCIGIVSLIWDAHLGEVLL